MLMLVVLDSRAHVVMFSLSLCPWRGAKYCDEYVCLSVCWSVSQCPLHNSKTTQPNFLSMLLTAMAQFCSGSIAVPYVLAVLWMMSLFHIMALWRVMCIPKWQA